MRDPDGYHPDIGLGGAGHAGYCDGRADAFATGSDVRAGSIRQDAAGGPGLDQDIAGRINDDGIPDIRAQFPDEGLLIGVIHKNGHLAAHAGAGREIGGDGMRLHIRNQVGLNVDVIAGIQGSLAFHVGHCCPPR